MKSFKSKTKLNNKGILSVVLAVALLFVNLSFTGCADLKHAIKAVKNKQKTETQEIEFENNVSKEMIIVEKVEELEDKEEVAGSELPEKDFAKAKEELVQGGSGPKYYAYEKLNDEDRVVYTEIYTILSTVAKDTKVSSKNPDQIEHCFSYVMLDHPELFYLTGYSFTKYMRGTNIEKITVSGSYTMNADQVEVAKMAVDAYVDKCISGYSGAVDDYEKVKYVYEYLIKNTEYDISAPNNQNILSVIKGGRTVCQGYAKAMQYILNKMGVFCILCEGTVKGTESHVWDIVKIGDNFYHVDATWGDASYMIEDNTEEFEAPEINYDYLCITDDEIKKTHVFKDNIELPVCDSMENNYYVREGLYLTELDTDIIKNAFDKARENGESMVTLKCENAHVYTALYKHLVDDHSIFDYLDGSTTVNYVEFRNECRISFYL